MRLIGNIIWIILGGLESCIVWLIFGIILHITIIGIPFGKQAFKIGQLSLLPFGKTVTREKGGAGRLLGNIIWFILFGLVLSLLHLVCGVIYCITIIGIPFGLQHFKLAKLSVSPFGVTIS